jgi:hypothetical protein
MAVDVTAFMAPRSMGKIETKDDRRHAFLAHVGL